MRLGVLCASIVGFGLVAAPLARAQFMGQPGFGALGKPSAPPAPRAAPPPALPGAASTTGAAPISRAPADMEPNEALFDAINRGDIATARDAVSRGADLRAQNVLGMTPLELAIDLGRNDIAFMLLSQRSPDDGRTRTQPVTASKQPAPVRQAKQQPPRQRVSTPASVPAAPQTARLFSGDGGAPNPSAGFLGFDAGRR